MQPYISQENVLTPSRGNEVEALNQAGDAETKQSRACVRNDHPGGHVICLPPRTWM